ncbi:HlyD family secretion protein [Ramlibacter sp.]|uniref:HlyD family secretion protein n=1 Tax=Ramlibacter sp. TaxID=1917967 RepID=UPI002609C16E|nr:HlyD family secretion protein [Ramlibacter sp.]MDB5958559.1 HlyD family secretion protein [Ramlibacter sp.]
MKAERELERARADEAAAAAHLEANERLDDPVETPQTPAARSRGWAPPKRGWGVTVVILVLAVIGALVVLYAWRLPPFTRALQTTDNAFVRGQTTIIAPQVSGYVREVLVQDYQAVRQGEVLVRIDDRVYAQRVEQAKAGVSTQGANLANFAQSQRSSAASVEGQAAAVANAAAQVTRARTDLARIEELAVDRSVSLRERDQAVATLRQAEAALRQAQAQHTVAQEQARSVTVGRGGLAAAVESARATQQLAQIDLANTVITAPGDGTVSEVGVRVGQYVTAGTQLLFLVPPTVWVVANFKEAQTARMAPGQLATVKVDALGGATLRGRVARLAPAAGNEFSVIKPDNATGNFIKVPQRISVRIELDPNQPLVARLRPGMSVEASVDTASRAAP